jgi:hypothetical protein
MPEPVGPAWLVGERLLRASGNALYGFGVADGALRYHRSLVEPECDFGVLVDCGSSLRLYQGHVIWVSRGSGARLIDPGTGDTVETLDLPGGVDAIIGHDLVGLGSYGEVRVLRGS